MLIESRVTTQSRAAIGLSVTILARLDLPDKEGSHAMCISCIVDSLSHMYCTLNLSVPCLLGKSRRRCKIDSFNSLNPRDSLLLWLVHVDADACPQIGASRLHELGAWPPLI